MVPYANNEQFIGRQEILDALHDALIDDKVQEDRRRLALHGLGGIGKTQIALAYAYQKRQYYHSVFWIDGSSRTTLLSGFRDIVSKINFPVESESPASKIAESALKWLEEHDSWLLIVDNLDDMSVVNDLLPSADCRGHTLVTTRNSVRTPAARGLEIGGLDFDCAVDLFYNHLFVRAKSDPSSRISMTSVSEFVKRLDCFPLAIVQSATFIRESGKDISDFLPCLQGTQFFRDTLLKNISDNDRYYQYSLVESWNLSLDAIKQTAESADAVTLLQFLAYLNPDFISFEFLQAGSGPVDQRLCKILKDPIQVHLSIQALLRHSFIRLNQDGRAIEIHRLVQEWIQHGMEEGDRLRWWEIVSQFFLDVFPSGSPTDFPDEIRALCRRYQDQVLVPLLKSPDIPSDNLAQACDKVAVFLLADGKFKQAELLLNKALKILRNLHRDRHQTTLNVVDHLATAYYYQGEINRAVPLNEELYHAQLAIHGPLHPETLKAAGDLAISYRSQSRLNEALELDNIVLEGRTKVFGEQHPYTLKAMASLASTYYAQGRWNDVSVLEERILEIRKATLGEEHVDTLSIMGNLAQTYQEQGRLIDAVKLNEMALDGFKKALGERHPLTIDAMSDLATKYYYQGRGDEALELQQSVLANYKIVLGDQHPSTLTAMTNLAASYSKNGQIKEALRLKEEVLESKMSTNGDIDPSMFALLDGLALDYRKLGRWDEAIALQETVVEKSKVWLGEQHPTTATLMENLASTFYYKGERDKAISIEETVLELRKSMLGPQHPETLNAQDALAMMKE
jgi:hypothetical protein